MENDDKLSWKAQGLFFYFKNTEQENDYTIDNLIKISSNGEHSTRSALKELKETGLIKENKIRDEKGQFVKTKYQLNKQPLNRQKQQHISNRKNPQKCNWTKMNNIKEKVGIYKLFNNNKEIIYIGKSKNLFRRIKKHLKTINCITYISYAITENINQASIYEPYYIEKFKPKLNKEYKTKNKLTVELPELEFSEIIKIRR